MTALLMINQQIGSGVASHSDEIPKLTSMKKIEHQLKINNSSYILVEAVPINKEHFRGIKLIRRKSFLNDGIFTGGQLRWIQPTAKLASNGDYLATYI